jgi:hypothetical protein
LKLLNYIRIKLSQKQRNFNSLIKHPYSVTRFGKILTFGLLRLLFTWWIFTCTSSFNTWFVADVLLFQKWFDVNVSFKLSLVVDMMASLATFSKNWAKFYSIFWSHWASATLVVIFIVTKWQKMKIETYWNAFQKRNCEKIEHSR